LPDTPSWRETRRAAHPLHKLFLSRHAQLVHAHGFLAALVCQSAVRRLPSPPRLVCTAHVLPQVRGGWFERAARRAGYRRVLRQADALIAVSAAVRDALLDLDPSVGPKTEVIFNGLDAGRYRVRVDVGLVKEQLGLDPAAATVGLIGRLAPEKGVEVFLQAASLVTRDVPNVDYVVVGDGPLRQELEQRAHDLHLTGCCVFLGERQEVPQILAALDALVVPSRHEAFGLVALEGVAAGVPVIASDTGGLHEILAGAPDVVLVPVGDPEAIAAAIIRILDRLPDEHTPLISDAERAAGVAPGEDDLLVSRDEYDLSRGLARQSGASREGSGPPGQRYVADHFSLTAMADQTAALYEELLGTAAGSTTPPGNGSD